MQISSHPGAVSLWAWLRGEAATGPVPDVASQAGSAAPADAGESPTYSLEALISPAVDAGELDFAMWQKYRSCLRQVLPLGDSATGQVLTFPLSAEAQLLRVAEGLRLRVGPSCSTDDVVLELSRRSGACLKVDADTTVDFDGARGVFRVVVEATCDTRLTLQTTQFDAVVNFLAQYILERGHVVAADAEVMP